MRVTDLMVGDWVNVNGLNLKVGAIHADEIGVFDPDYKIYWCSDDGLDSVDPIPLTEEILAKNFGGYDHIDYDHEGRVPCYFVGNRRIFVDSVMDKGHCFYFCHKDDWAGVHDIEIHYVHQLQQLLRLCGIDKEIIL